MKRSLTLLALLLALTTAAIAQDDIKEVKSSASDPGACAVGRVYINTTSPGKVWVRIGGTCVRIDGIGAGTGTVTSFSAGDLSPLFTTSEATATTTPALTFSLSNAAAHTFFGNNTGSTAAPGFQAIGVADLPSSIDAAKIGGGGVSTTEFDFLGTLSSNAQTQLDGKQPLDADLSDIAGLTATTDNFLVSVSSAWASRTPAQVKTTLSLDNVTNTSDANKPVSTATQAALDTKQSTITFGTGVQTALGVNIGSAGAPLLFNGAGGTPSSITLSSGTGLPISTGLTGAGTGVLSALGVNVGSAGAFVVNGGALGSPSSAGTMPAFVMGGHMTASPDNTFDIGASGSTRPRNVYVAGFAVIPRVSLGGFGEFRSTVDGIIVMSNNAQTDFTRLQLGGTTSSFPSIKRSGTGLIARLADDSADAPFTSSTATHSSLTSGRVTFASTGGLLVDDADLTFATDTLTATKFSGPTVGVATNSNAATGIVGEEIKAERVSGSALGLTTATDTDITSLVSLPAGDYEISGNVIFSTGAATTVSLMSVSLSTASATRDVTTLGSFANDNHGGGLLASANTNVLVGPQRFSLASPTTIYLVVRSTFGADVMNSYGVIRARRMR